MYGVAINSSANKTKITRNNILGNKFGIFINLDFEYLSNNVIAWNNNLIGNNINAVYKQSFFNLWYNNYWDDWDKSTPRPIDGEIRLERLDDRIIPWVQFDWKPALEPYDIGGFDE